MSLNGRIPLYDRGRLVNESGGAIDVPNVGAYQASYGNTYINEVERNLDEANRQAAKIRAEQEAIEAKKRELADNIAAEKFKIQWENQYYKELEQQKQSNASNPYGLYDNIYDMTNKSLQQYMENNISNSNVKDLFVKKTTSSISAIQNNVRSWASGQTVTNAFSDIQASLDELYKQAGNIGSPSGLAGLMSQGESLVNNAELIIGKEAADKIRNTSKRQMSENFVYSQIDNNPTMIKGYMQSGMFDGIFDDKEQFAITRTANTILNKNRIEQERANRVADSQVYRGIVDRASAGNMTLAEINREIQREKARGGSGTKKRLDNLMRIRDDIVLRGNYPNAALSDHEALALVQDAFSGVTKDKKSKSVTPSYSLANATYEQLSNMQSVLDDNAIYLSKSVRDKFYGMMSQLWEDSLSNNKYYQENKKYQNSLSTGKGFTNYSEFYNIYNTLISYIDTNIPKASQNELKVLFSEEFSKKYDSYIQTKGYSPNKLIQYWIRQFKGKAGGY